MIWSHRNKNANNYIFINVTFDKHLTQPPVPFNNVKLRENVNKGNNVHHTHTRSINLHHFYLTVTSTNIEYT